MDAKGVRNMYSILVVFNKHNTARVAYCWFIIHVYYRLVMHGNSNIKKIILLIIDLWFVMISSAKSSAKSSASQTMRR